MPQSPKRDFLIFGSFFFFLVFLLPQFCPAILDEEIRRVQTELQEKTPGEKIAYWAEKFIGTPYDEDPQGAYVSKAAIVADEKVDCMYLTFRAVELALSQTPEEAIQVALEKRFHSRGILQDGKVTNYYDRFEYGEDMIASDKWGREITPKIGRSVQIKGSRGKDSWTILLTAELLRGMEKIKSGDIIFFATRPEKRKADEGVGHIGIAKIERHGKAKEIYLIHASGLKNKGGAVKKVLLKDYVGRMPFAGVRITRFD